MTELKDLNERPTDEELLLAANIIRRAHNQAGWFTHQERGYLRVTADALESVTHFGP